MLQNTPPSKSVNILLIEDDNDDVELLQDALAENEFTHKMHVIKDGGLVATYIDTVTAVPDIIIMDLNLPKVHGREVIKMIRQTDLLASVPLVVLTTSSSENDISYCYKEGASKHIVKPTTSAGFREVVDTLHSLLEQ